MNKLKNHFKKHWPIWLIAGSYFIIVNIICLVKYFQFGYNGFDLAIFNQVLYNTSFGRLFQFTIHPQSYLGDHFDLSLIFLVPFYWLLRQPITLLILQTSIISLSAWPLYLIAKTKLPNKIIYLIVTAFFLNPFLQNLNLFEFHEMCLAIFFLLWCFYFYQQEKFKPFILFLLLSLTVREDVALVTLMFSVVAWLDQRSKKWIFTPLIISSAWFVMAMKFIDYFTPAGSYKYLYYYSWLGSSLPEIAKNFFLKPVAVLQHLFGLNNLAFTLGLFMPYCYLCWLKPKYLLLALPIYLEITLGGTANPILALKMHYYGLFVMPLIVALIYSLNGLLQNHDPNWLIKKMRIIKPYIWLILIISSIYGSLTYGPIIGFAQKLIKPNYSSQIIQLKNDYLSKIQPTDSVASSYELITNLSSRTNLYSMHYAFIGKKQFTSLNYQLPTLVDKIILDFDDLLIYSIQFPNSLAWKDYYTQGPGNLRKTFAAKNYNPTAITDSLALFEKKPSALKFYEISDKLPLIDNRQAIDFGNGLKFLGWSKIQPTNNSTQLLPISLFFTTDRKLANDWQLRLKILDQNNQVIHQKIYALAYGLYPTSEWLPNQIIKTNYWFLLPPGIDLKKSQIQLELLTFKGYLGLDGWRSIVMNITKENILTPAIKLDYFTR